MVNKMVKLELSNEFEIVRISDDYYYCLVNKDVLLNYVKENEPTVFIPIDSKISIGYNISKYLAVGNSELVYLLDMKESEFQLFVSINRTSLFIENPVDVSWHRELHNADTKNKK